MQMAREVHACLLRDAAGSFKKVDLTMQDTKRV